MSKEFGFTRCSVLNDNKMYVAGVAVELEDDDVHHAILFEHVDGDWDKWSFEHRLAGIASYEENGIAKLITAGVDGHIETADFDGAQEERITAGDNETAPGLLCPLHCIRIIGDHAYVAGTARQVFRRRLGETEWTRSDHGCVIPCSSHEIGSFHDIDGPDENFLVAAGLGGEIWLSTSGTWEKLDSPTHVRLEAVKHLGGTGFIAAGAEGTIIMGDGETLRALEQDSTKETFSSIEEAFGKIYLCTDQGNLFCIGRDGALGRVDTGLPASPGGGSLSFNERSLLFACDFHVVLFDGNDWQELHPA
ncbi:hypothetical protein [Marilutibacter alkalisoli]|uniref:WD40 repeat domain-containing protein n=1 Tax=Marilutibacter alkalisoli TaxID=2591633 RepID=A0A514BSI5_9GAMM|nr:hypothetical protein [Lysobacter alkalisoli]QDH70344.1 hypothetical protein FKV23_09760 [Lysobacter alkalisoli]